MHNIYPWIEVYNVYARPQDDYRGPAGDCEQAPRLPSWGLYSRTGQQSRSDMDPDSFWSVDPDPEVWNEVLLKEDIIVDILLNEG